MGITGGRDGAWHDSLMHRYWPAVVRAAVRILGVESAEAQDLAQKTFMVAWSKRAEVPDEAWPWLYQTVRWMAANHRRGRSRFTDAVRQIGPLVVAERDAMNSVEIGQDFIRACRRLSLPEKEAIVYAARGMTDTEISSIVGALPATVRRRLHRARHKLRQALGDYAGDQRDGQAAHTGGQR